MQRMTLRSVAWACRPSAGFGALVGATICLMSALPCAARSPFAAEFDLHDLRAAQGGDGTEGVVYYYDPDCTDCVAVFGRHVSGMGDVDGDGIDDLIVGDPKSLAIDDPPRGGEAFAVFGHSPPFAAESVHDDMPFILQSDVAGEDDGAGVVTRLGDVNGDGLEDIAVAAPALPLMGLKGKVFVLYGSDTGFPPVFRLQDLESGDGSLGVVFNGASIDDHVGYDIAGGCDVNADGIDDLIIGAPGSDTVGGDNSGAVGIVWGRPDFPPVFELIGLIPGHGGDGSEGIVLTGVMDQGGMGTSTACAGDINADGIDDVALTENRGGTTALAYLYFGNVGPFDGLFPLDLLLPANGGDGTQGVVINGPEDILDVSGAGDVDGDGADDLVLGTPKVDAGGRDQSGEVFVLYGRGSGFESTFRLADLLPSQGGDGSEGFALAGARVGDSTGTAVAGVRDVDGDGFDDLLLGAPGVADDAEGRAFLVFGRPRAVSPALVELSSLFAVGGGDGQTGVVFAGEDESLAGPGSAGASVAGAGDIDGDGFADLLVGAPDAGSNGDAGEGGAAYLLFGRSRDRDADGVVDREDNCTLEANADQRDTNGDGIGNACDPDLDGDCLVNFVDLGLLKGVFFSGDPDADFDGDGFVNFEDLGIMKEFFFGVPGPSDVALTCGT